MKCEYCTHYFFNGRNTNADNSCFGPEDCRKSHFECNQKLAPNYDDTMDIIRELQKRGYKVEKKTSQSEKEKIRMTR